MSNGNEGHSRRQVLTTVGKLSIAGAMGPAIASSSLVTKVCKRAGFWTPG